MIRAPVGDESVYKAWVRMGWRKWFVPLNPFTKKELVGAYPALVMAKIKAWKEATGFSDKDGEVLVLPEGEEPWLRKSG